MIFLLGYLVAMVAVFTAGFLSEPDFLARVIAGSPVVATKTIAAPAVRMARIRIE